eukprot:PhF_6_TR27895/c0_g1_i1/m.40884
MYLIEFIEDEEQLSREEFETSCLQRLLTETTTFQRTFYTRIATTLHHLQRCRFGITELCDREEHVREELEEWSVVERLIVGSVVTMQSRRTALAWEISQCLGLESQFEIYEAATFSVAFLCICEMDELYAREYVYFLECRARAALLWVAEAMVDLQWEERYTRSEIVMDEDESYSHIAVMEDTVSYVSMSSASSIEFAQQLAIAQSEMKARNSVENEMLVEDVVIHVSQVVSRAVCRALSGGSGSVLDWNYAKYVDVFQSQRTSLFLEEAQNRSIAEYMAFQTLESPTFLSEIAESCAKALFAEELKARIQIEMEEMEASYEDTAPGMHVVRLTKSHSDRISIDMQEWSDRQMIVSYEEMEFQRFHVGMIVGAQEITPRRECVQCEQSERTNLGVTKCTHLESLTRTDIEKETIVTFETSTREALSKHALLGLRTASNRSMVEKLAQLHYTAVISAELGERYQLYDGIYDAMLGVGKVSQFATWSLELHQLLGNSLQVQVQAIGDMVYAEPHEQQERTKILLDETLVREDATRIAIVDLQSREWHHSVTTYTMSMILESEVSNRAQLAAFEDCVWERVVLLQLENKSRLDLEWLSEKSKPRDDPESLEEMWREVIEHSESKASPIPLCKLILSEIVERQHISREHQWSDVLREYIWIQAMLGKDRIPHEAMLLTSEMAIRMGMEKECMVAHPLRIHALVLEERVKRTTTEVLALRTFPKFNNKFGELQELESDERLQLIAASPMAILGPQEKIQRDQITQRVGLVQEESSAYVQLKFDELQHRENTARLLIESMAFEKSFASRYALNVFLPQLRDYVAIMKQYRKALRMLGAFIPVEVMRRRVETQLLARFYKPFDMILLTRYRKMALDARQRNPRPPPRNARQEISSRLTTARLRLQNEPGKASEGGDHGVDTTGHGSPRRNLR